MVSSDSTISNEQEVAREIIGTEYNEVYIGTSTNNIPGNPEIVIDMNKLSTEEAANYVVKSIIKHLINESSVGQFLNF
ncbi:hypothetical protein D3C85_1714540 [compost metagenome]